MTTPLLSRVFPGGSRFHSRPLHPNPLTTGGLYVGPASPNNCRREGNPPRVLTADLLIPPDPAQRSWRVEQCGSARRPINNYPRTFTQFKAPELPDMFHKLPVFSNLTSEASTRG